MTPETFTTGATAAAVPHEGSAAPGSPAAAPAIPDPAATLARLAALPPLAPRVPMPGHTTRVAPLPGSSDALALAQLAQQCAAGKRMLAAIAADAQGAHRIAEELPWFAPGVRVALLPDWETLPYDPFSPHHDLISERLATLYRVSRGECDVLVVAATTALHRLAPPSYLAAFTFFLKQGTTLDVDALRAQLALAGYHHVTQVVSPGEFSIRGGLIDLFPMGSPLPYRLDLFGDDIESIKTFDVDTQRTLYPVPDIRLLPAREFPLDETGRTRFRSRYREVFEGDPSKSPLYRDVSSGIAPGGIEYYLPLFFETTATLADYLPRDALVARVGDIGGAVARFWQDTDARYRLLRGDKARPLLPPAEVFVPEDAFNAALKPFARIEWNTDARAAPIEGVAAPLPSVQVDRRADDPLAALKRFLADARGMRVLICAESAGRRETMHQYFAEYGLRLPHVDHFGRPSRRRRCRFAHRRAGRFVWPAAKLALVTEPELYAGVVRAAAATARAGRTSTRCRATSPRCAPATPSSTSSTGSAAISASSRWTWAGHRACSSSTHNAKLYVRVETHLIGRYSGTSPDSAPLHELGSGQ